MIFSVFQKKLGFLVFLVHPTVVSVLLSALVERCFVSRMPDFQSIGVLDDFFLFFKKIGFLGILGPPYCGIGAAIRIGREMLCLPYAGLL